MSSNKSSRSARSAHLSVHLGRRICDTLAAQTLSRISSPLRAVHWNANFDHNNTLSAENWKLKIVFHTKHCWTQLNSKLSFWNIYAAMYFIDLFFDFPEKCSRPLQLIFLRKMSLSHRTGSLVAQWVNQFDAARSSQKQTPLSECNITFHSTKSLSVNNWCLYLSFTLFIYFRPFSTSSGVSLARNVVGVTASMMLMMMKTLRKHFIFARSISNNFSPIYIFISDNRDGAIESFYHSSDGISFSLKTSIKVSNAIDLRVFAIWLRRASMDRSACKCRWTTEGKHRIK